jgi:ribosomal small subunit protein bTHX
MGKGDIKTKKGKRIRGSYGKSRVRKPESANKAPVKADAAKEEK